MSIILQARILADTDRDSMLCQPTSTYLYNLSSYAEWLDWVALINKWQTFYVTAHSLFAVLWRMLRFGNVSDLSCWKGLNGCFSAKELLRKSSICFWWCLLELYNKVGHVKRLCVCAIKGHMTSYTLSCSCFFVQFCFSQKIPPHDFLLC